MEKITMNTGTVKPQNTEIDNTKKADQTQTPEKASDTLVNQPTAAPAVFKSTEEKTKDKTSRRHSVIYLAGGIWKDSTGIYWCREEKANCISSLSLSEEEFDVRGDIKYMIEYGAMKDVVSE